MPFRDYIFNFKFMLVNIEEIWQRKCQNIIFRVTPFPCYFIPLFSGLPYLCVELRFEILGNCGWMWCVHQRGAQST